jgi:hypothetical protein
MKWVEKLATAECPGTCACCQPCNELSIRHCLACQCQGTGSLIPGLRRQCHKCVWFRLHGCECTCQGQGWVLIPQVEWMGVLVRLCEQPMFYHAKDGTWYVDLWQENDTISCKGDTPEEALAHAICQEKGVN